MPAAAVHASLVAGQVAAVPGGPTLAASSWAAALELSRSAPVLVRLRGRVAGALAGRLAGDDAAVLRHSRAGLADLARHRSALASYELRVLASGPGRRAGPARAGRAGPRPGRRRGSWTGWSGPGPRRCRRSAPPARAPAAGGSAGLEAELAAMRAAYERAAGRRRPAGRADRRGRPSWRPGSGRAPGCVPAARNRRPRRRLSLAALRGQLGDRILVEYDLLDGDVIAAVVEPPGSAWSGSGRSPRSRYEIGALLFALRRLARGARVPAAALATARTGLRRLTALLLDPLELPDHPGLVVVPVGPLQRVPWSALHPGPVSIAPAAAMWERSARRRPARRGRGTGGRAGRARRVGRDRGAGRDAPGRGRAAAAGVDRRRGGVGAVHGVAWPTWPATGGCGRTTRSSPRCCWPTGR